MSCFVIEQKKHVMLYNIIYVIVCVMFVVLDNMCRVIEQNKTEHVMLYNTCVNMFSYIIYVIICYNYITGVMLCYVTCVLLCYRVYLRSTNSINFV